MERRYICNLVDTCTSPQYGKLICCKENIYVDNIKVCDETCSYKGLNMMMDDNQCVGKCIPYFQYLMEKAQRERAVDRETTCPILMRSRCTKEECEWYIENSCAVSALVTNISKLLLEFKRYESRMEERTPKNMSTYST